MTVPNPMPYAATPRTPETWPGSPPPPRSGFPLWVAAIAGVLILILVVAVLARAAGWHSPFAAAASTHTATATAQPTPVPAFDLNQTYRYHYPLGHSKMTSLTNNDVSVTLETLGFSAATNATTLVVSFFDADGQKGTDFAFEGVPNVYLVDQSGNHYLGVTASPQEIILGPGQGGTLTVTLSLIRSGVTSLQLTFNTDRFALDTLCTVLTPTGQPATCPGQ